MATFERCNHCGELRYCDGGICSDCAGYQRATGFFSFGSRPDCPSCNGTGTVTHILGPATKCPDCHGTGKL